MKILVLHGHPQRASFGSALASTYAEAARAAGAIVCEIELSALRLHMAADPRTINSPEDDLRSVQDMILWADHIVLEFPSWWSTFPAIVKSFLDRAFTAGFGFRYEGKLFPAKLLEGKTGRLIVTMDAPVWWYRLINRAPGLRAVKYGVFQFCGIRPVAVRLFGQLRKSSPEQRQRWLNAVSRDAAADSARLRKRFACLGVARVSGLQPNHAEQLPCHGERLVEPSGHRQATPSNCKATPSASPEA